MDILFISIIVITSVFCFGIYVGTILKSILQKQNRRGVMISEFEWIRYGYKYSRKITVVVEELDRVADHSKIKIISIEGILNDSISIISNQIGEWWLTNDFKWEEIEKTKSKKLK